MADQIEDLHFFAEFTQVRERRFQMGRVEVDKRVIQKQERLLSFGGENLGQRQTGAEL